MRQSVRGGFMMGKDQQQIHESDELDEGQLESVVGGVATTPIEPQSTDSAVSNVLKTRHDTAKNSIGNIR